MFNEIWIQWKPIQNLEQKYEVDDIIDSITSFNIHLSAVDNTNKKIILTFKESVFAYRRTDETFRHQLIAQLKNQYGDAFYGEWTFFKVENSSYISWLSAQSCSIADGYKLMHIVILGTDQVVDIATTYEPMVEVLVHQ